MLLYKSETFVVADPLPVKGTFKIKLFFIDFFIQFCVAWYQNDIVRTVQEHFITLYFDLPYLQVLPSYKNPPFSRFIIITPRLAYHTYHV